MLTLFSVLLVDDDPATNHLNELLLKQLDVADQYLSAIDGVEAFAVLKQLAA
ncbi:response regulator [Hymenobacter puniceus]|uniref:hypothetical protein n=1 Tax=Hymenobacter sp. BT190 TaxID=2763505 RepID=UPI0016517219|nr:hypothetical protein [Hymenobacter sp. BT190]MBC6698423.1 hypothetical protein [Hymenobacter sp. BT190]